MPRLGLSDLAQCMCEISGGNDRQARWPEQSRGLIVCRFDDHTPHVVAAIRANHMRRQRRAAFGANR